MAENISSGMRSVQLLRNMIGSFTVRCPNCGNRMKASTTRTVLCRRCGNQFDVYPRGMPSRIVHCDPNRQRMLLHLYNLENEPR